MQNSQRLNKDLQNQERMSHDELDIGATKKDKELTQEEYDEADEYSYHDDESVNSNNNNRMKQEQREMVAMKPAPQNQESDIEEDYEF